MFFIALIPFLIITGIIKLVMTLKKPKISLVGRHVCITGGSSGIGKSVAILAAEKGAHVTIIARNKFRLDETLKSIEAVRVDNGQIFTALAQDCANKNLITTNLQELDDKLPIYMLVNCAGMALCGRVEEMSLEDIKMLFDVNYFATLFPIQAVVTMMKRRKEGIIVLSGSQGGLFGIFGYSIYASAKFALRGLAEVLHMELKDYNVSVTIALPPDTDTPGFENENKTKPIETKLISESGGLFKSDEVAKQLLKDAMNKKFFSVVGFESWLLTTLCIGMTPFSHLFDIFLQAFLLGPFRLISCYYLNSFHNIITKCKEKREVEDKSEISSKEL